MAKNKTNFHSQFDAAESQERSARSDKTMRIDITTRQPRPKVVPRTPIPRVIAGAPPMVGDGSFQELFQSVYDAAMIAMPDGVVLDANLRALEFFLCTRSELVGRNVADLIVGFDSPLFDTLKHNLATHRFALIQAFCMRQDGSSFPAEISVSVLHPGGSNYLCFFFRDVTVRHQAEEALRAERNLLATLINNLPDFVYVKDLRRRYVMANNAVARHFGLETPEDLIGRRDDELYPAEIAEAAAADDRRVLENGESLINREEQSVDRSGRRLILLTAKVPLRDAGGRVTGLVGISRDITEKRFAESQREHAQKLESIGQLAAGIAHEINTPIQYVGDNLRFLKDAFGELFKLLELHEHFAKNAGVQLPPELAAARTQTDVEYLVREIPLAVEQSLEGAGRVARIVQAMKEFSHPDTEEKAPADINRAIESTLAVSRNEWKYVADLVTDFDPTLPPVPCLLGHFNQVILNLVVNAAHAIAAVVGDGSRGKGRLTVATRRDGDWAEIRVSDTGTGIPEKYRSRIFEPFFTTKEIGKGTGQGLATCHAIVVKKHGGTISFETEVGKGTTFIVRLPLS